MNLGTWHNQWGSLTTNYDYKSNWLTEAFVGKDRCDLQGARPSVMNQKTEAVTKVKALPAQAGLGLIRPQVEHLSRAWDQFPRRRGRSAHISSAWRAVLQHHRQTVHQLKKKRITQTPSPIAANDLFHYASYVPPNHWLMGYLSEH